MEGLQYTFMLIALIVSMAAAVVLAIAALVSLIAFVGGVVGIVSIPFTTIGKKKGSVHHRGLFALGLATAAAILLVVGFKIWQSIEPGRFISTPANERATCLELRLAEGYRLQIARFQDGTWEAGLESSESGEGYIHGITRYAIEGQYILGEIGPLDSPYYWFWFDLTDTGPGHLFGSRTEFDQAIQEIGLSQDLTLLPISIHCETSGCRPCNPR